MEPEARRGIPLVRDDVGKGALVRLQVGAGGANEALGVEEIAVPPPLHPDGVDTGPQLDTHTLTI